jgi:deoxyribodipyrimidine photo-lyase
MLAIPQLVLPFEKFSSPIDSALWPAGEKVAKRHLQHFIQHTLFSYDQTRDYPAIEGTSRLSPYLATGMISPRQCFLAALAANQGELTTGNKGALTWMSELIWREFYKHILVAYPRVSMHLPYRLETKKIDWRYNEKQWLAWQHGNTGYPIVDAAMRQLNTTGWMHNRLRMIVAMFFTKNLFFDWRLGEQYFIEHLIDGDLAANNGGWQWCASTGTDAAPYFRVFNTVTQSERFDEKGKFIRRYCPELTSLSDDTIHDPHGRAPLLVQKLHYPASIVNLALSRKHAIETFKYLSTNANQ